MDIESLLRSLSQTVSEGDLRRFGCECCERSLHLCNESILRETISLGYARIAGPVDVSVIRSVGDRAYRVYLRLCPDDEEASPEALAFSAGGEVAFTESSLTAAIGAAEFSADAIARDAAERVPDSAYYDVYKPTLESERQWQLELLQKYIP